MSIYESSMDRDRNGVQLHEGDSVKYEPGVGGSQRTGTVRYTGMYGVDVQNDSQSGIFGQDRALNRTVEKI